MSTAEQKTETKNPAERSTADVTLDYPIARSGQKITKLTLRKPKAGTLHGLSLTALMQMQADEVMVLLPRIVEPTLLEKEVRDLEPSDMLQCAMEVATFLAPKAVLGYPIESKA